MHGAYYFIIIWFTVIMLNAIFEIYFKEKIIAWLVFQANSSPWFSFYPLKDKLLKQYGKLIGYEYQHFDALECNRCGGTGEFWTYYTNREECWCCGGTGIYKPEAWIGLSKYQFGKYQFHIPIGKVEGDINPRPHPGLVIDGKITHKKQKYSNDANLVLKICYGTDAYPKFKFGDVYCNGKELSIYDYFNNHVKIMRYPWNFPHTFYSKIYVYCWRKLVDLKLIDDLPF